MPVWMRLPKTSKTSNLAERMGSALENGYGDEGPLAQILAVGGCYTAILLVLLILVGILGGAVWGIWLLGAWIL